MKAINQQVDQLFQDYDRPDTPGCSLAILQHGRIAYKKGFGKANLEYATPITPQTIFHVASVSKQFTAMAIVLLAQSGKIDLDDEVRKYIPELPDFERKITIRHLIHHTSGLRDQWELLILAGWRMDDVITTADILELVKNQKELNFAPGSEYLYCNSGYTLLALIVERVTGKSFREYCRENLFEPLGMVNTHFHDDHTEIVRNRAYSYAPKEGGGFKHSVLSYATAGATSLFTTAEDLACWDENFYSGQVGGDAAIGQMHEQGVLNDKDLISYAFGLVVSQYRGLKIVEHSGGDAGFRSHLLRFPDEHFAVVILCNLSTMKPGILCRQIADLYLDEEFNAKGEPLEKQDQTYTHNITQSDLERYAGVYYNAHRNESMELEMRAEKLFLSDGPGFELLPMSRDCFALTGYSDSRLIFGSKDATEIDELVMATPGTPSISFSRLAPLARGIDQLKDYAGVYYSPELEVNYLVEIQDDRLGVRRRKYEFIPLEPTVPDGFRGENADILFQRDPENTVRGLVISTGRVRNLKFEKRSI